MDEQKASSMEEREKMVERYFGHHTLISGVVGHSVGRAFFSSDWDGALIGWLAYSEDDFGGAYDKNLFKGRFYADIPANIRSKRKPDQGISALEVSRDGEFLGIGTEDGFVEVWRVKGFELAARRQLHSGRVMSVALSENGDRIASVGKDSKVRVSLSIADPMNTISPTALPLQLIDLSEHTVPSAQTTAFASAKQLAVTTKTGELVEVTLDDPSPPLPAATPRVTRPSTKDADY
jgi:WD40 repeat protein